MIKVLQLQMNGLSRCCMLLHAAVCEVVVLGMLTAMLSVPLTIPEVPARWIGEIAKVILEVRCSICAS